jgi:hypothetical protein
MDLTRIEDILVQDGLNEIEQLLPDILRPSGLRWDSRDNRGRAGMKICRAWLSIHSPQ